MVFHYETAAVNITFVEQTQHYNQASACFPALYIPQRFAALFLVFSIGFCVYKGPEMIFRTYSPYGTRKPSLRTFPTQRIQNCLISKYQHFSRNTKLPSKCQNHLNFCSPLFKLIQSSARVNFNYQKYTNKQQIPFLSSKC